MYHYHYYYKCAFGGPKTSAVTACASHWDFSYYEISDVIIFLLFSVFFPLLYLFTLEIGILCFTEKAIRANKLRVRFFMFSGFFSLAGCWSLEFNDECYFFLEHFAFIFVIAVKCIILFFFDGLDTKTLAIINASHNVCEKPKK